MLDKQIYLYQFDTSDFYSNREKRIHDRISQLRQEKARLGAWIKVARQTASSQKAASVETANGEKITSRIADGVITIKSSRSRRVKSLAVDDLNEYIERWEFCSAHKHRLACKLKHEVLLPMVANKAEHNIASHGADHVRELREGSAKTVISTFDSALTRATHCEVDEITDVMCSVTIFYFDIFKDILHHGFMWNGEKYIYYTSSAGMIRTKRTIFIKESVFKEIELKMMCGLTVDEINRRGGNNVNKHLAYLALSNSATDVWEDFDIDRCIVVDDFEPLVNGEVDFIDNTEFNITRKRMDIPIPVTDGIGMMLPSVSTKNFMVRAPWFKGLLAVFDFRSFIEEYNYSPIVKDIYGDEHNILEEDIRIIFTKSQFKMYKYYDNFDDYKAKYKTNGCETGICNVEEDYIKNSKINYQMLQDLSPTEEEMKKITERSRKKIENVSKNIKTIKDILGLNRHDISLTPFQKAIKIYPPLIRDSYTKDTLRGIKNSLLKKYRAGKIEISGKYTFIVPDLWSACHFWFGGVAKPPVLLKNGEVSCRLYSHADELDCLRAPHIYYEHAIRQNVFSDEIKKWFTTDAIYVSADDLISLVLMFDDRNQCRTV